MEVPYQTKLLELLNEQLSVDELKTVCLCVDLFQYEELPEGGKRAKITSMIQECRRRNALAQLLDCVAAGYPHTAVEIQQIRAKMNQIPTPTSLPPVPPASNPLLKWGMIVLGVVILGIAMWFVFSPLIGSPPAAERFTYQIQVRDKVTTEFLKGAEVRLVIGANYAPKTTFTDNNGTAFFELDGELIGRTVRAEVSLMGYESNTTNITLQEGVSPYEIRLEPVN